MVKLHPALVPFQPGGRFWGVELGQHPGLAAALQELEVALVQAEWERGAALRALSELVAARHDGRGKLPAEHPAEIRQRRALDVARHLLAALGPEL